MSDDKIVTCVYCGHEYPPGTPTSQHELLTAHIEACRKHPMREKAAEIRVAMRILRRVLPDGGRDDMGLIEAACTVVSVVELLGHLADECSKRETLRGEDWRFVRVDYGADIGLVELNRGLLVMSTWDTSRVSVMSDVPKVVVEDREMTELFGDEHSWEDVVGLLKKHYDWERKVLPDMAELRKHYQPPTAG